MDRFVRSLFLAAGFKAGLRAGRPDTVAVVALGSYGRRELCLASDVDLMVIHQGKLSPEMGKVIPKAIYPLWDTKLEVGHSIWTVQECIRLAFSDFKVLTALMDARFLLGSRSFYTLFQSAFWSRVERGQTRLLNEFLVSRRRREERYETEAYFVEPEIKEGLGGLRDIHFMAWVARIYFNCRRLPQLRRFSAFSHFGFDKLSYSASFLLKIRNHLHLLTGRKEDRLLLSHHETLARMLDYEDRDHIHGSDQLMRDVYRHLNRVRYSTEEFLSKTLDIVSPQTTRQKDPEPLARELTIVKGNITLKDLSLLRADPHWILVALDRANHLNRFLGSELIWEARGVVARAERRLRSSSRSKTLFLEIILNPLNPRVIRLALEIGLIGLFIPEFKKIRNLPEFGHYHVRTVDLHSLETLNVLGRISRGAYDDRWPLLREIFEQLQHPERLFLAGLLHDIGKGYTGDHSRRGAELIPGVLKRFGFTGEAVKQIPFLVEHHLLLANISQRRDLTEERTAVDVAQTVRGTSALDMLFLLTVADSLATGPIARSDWKIMLIVELFLKVRHLLERGTLTSPDATKKILAQQRRVAEQLQGEFPREAVRALTDQASSRYFLNTRLDDILDHFRLALTRGERKFVWTLHKRTDAPVTRVLQCLEDRPGLFSKMAGVFALNDMNVLSAHIYTLKRGLAFDIYEVTNPLDPYREEERWEKVHREIGLALEDRLPLDELLEEKSRGMPGSKQGGKPLHRKVQVDNEISDFFTAIEFVCAPRARRLYDVARAVFSLGLDIRFAKVNTDHEQTRGMLYLRDSEGQKIYEPERIEAVKRTIASVTA